MIPICVSSRIGVNSEEKVVLVGTYLYHTIQIPILEGTVKCDFRGQESGVHPFEGSVEKRGTIVVIVS